MNVIGVVGEFNPFHLGHYEHFQKSRALLGQDAPILCVMSGDFVQRGGPACFDKHVRARMAVQSGADLVLELPLPWCTASAERFALGAVGLLDGLGVVTHLSFGSEAGQLAPLTALAIAAADRDNLDMIKARMAADGIPFPAAREMVLREQVGPEARLLQTPNNILAVEYLKALIALDAAMEPVTTRRRESAHDKLSDGRMRSAAQIRAMLEAGEDAAPFMPPAAAAAAAREMAAGRGPVTMEGLEQGLMARLRLLRQEDFQALPDATEGLGNRLYKAVREEGTVMGVLAAVKTKRYPLSRLRRMVMCAALGVRADMGGNRPPYARVLASTGRGRELLRRMDGRAAVPVVTKPASAKDLPEQAREIFTLTADARDLYVLGREAADSRRGGTDWRASPATEP